MALSVVLCFILNQDFTAWLTYLYMLLAVFLGLSLSKILSIEEIVKYYTAIVLFLSFTSLLGFYGVLENVLSFLKYSFVFRDQDYSYYLFYGQIQGIDDRNFSLFVEPGLFQIHLIFGLIFLIYRFGQNDKYYFLKIFIILWAVYTTKSTTAYILVFMLFTYASLKFGKHVIAKIFYILIGSMVSVYLISLAEFQDNINGKFSGAQSASYLARAESTNADLVLFKDNLITGVGFGNYISKMADQGFYIDTATNTFTQIAAILGLFPIILISGVLLLFGLEKKVGFGFKLMYVVSLIICFSVQPFLLYPFFYLLIFLTFRFKGLGVVKN